MMPTDCFVLRTPTILPAIRISWCLRPTFMLISGRVSRSFYHQCASTRGFRPFDPDIFSLLYHFFKSNSTFFSIVTKFCHQIYISVHCQSVNYTEIPAIYTGQLCPSTRWICSVIPQDICMPQVQPLPVSYTHLTLPTNSRV